MLLLLYERTTATFLLYYILLLVLLPPDTQRRGLIMTNEVGILFGVESTDKHLRRRRALKYHLGPQLALADSICRKVIFSMSSLISTGSSPIPEKYHKNLGKILFSEDAIAKRVSELAAEISKDYAGKEILIVGLLKGAILFVSDLVKKLTVPASINFIIASSYGHGVS